MIHADEDPAFKLSASLRHLLLFYIQVMIYLIDKVLPESYFANNLRALSGKHKQHNVSGNCSSLHGTMCVS